MADADGIVRGETLGLFLDIFNESELDHLFDKGMDNIRREEISYRYALICFVRLIWFHRFLSEYFKSFLFWINIKVSISNSDWQIAFIWSYVNSFIDNLANFSLV